MVPDFDRICRLCLTKDEDMVPIFGESEKSKPNLSERIENCTCLKISRSDGLPAAMCVECLKKLDQIKEFKDQCIRSDTLLRQFLQSKELNVCDGKDRGRGPGRTKQGSASKRRKKNENSPQEDKDNFFEEESSSIVVSAGLHLKQELESHIKQENLVLKSGVSLPSVPSEVTSQERNKGNTIQDECSEEDEDNEYTWPGSLSDDEVEQNMPSDQHTEIIQNGEEIQGPKKRARPQRSYECEFCGRVFPRSNHLAQHELTHTKDKPFHCSYCEKSFWYKNSLIGHIKQTHTGDVNYTCEECGRGFFQRSEFNRHKPIHSTETPFKCSECGMAFKLVKNLRRHQKVHTGLRTHTCQYCGKSFRMLQTLRVHLILHTGEKPFKCTYCGKGFSQSAPLKAHTRMHTGERPYVCNLCGEAFPTGNALKAHTFKHTGIHPNSCRDCSVVFKRKRDLIEHRDQVHGGAVTQPVQVTPLLPQDPLHLDEKTNEEIQQQHSHISVQHTVQSQVQQSPPQVNQVVQHLVPNPHVLSLPPPTHLINAVLTSHDTLRPPDHVPFT